MCSFEKNFDRSYRKSFSFLLYVRRMNTWLYLYIYGREYIFFHPSLIYAYLSGHAFEFRILFSSFFFGTIQVFSIIRYKKKRNKI